MRQLMCPRYPLAGAPSRAACARGWGGSIGLFGFALAIMLAVSACGEADAPAADAPLPAASSVTLDSVGDQVVHGTIGGDAFEARDQRFIVVARAGRERVDLVFADQHIERCGLPLARDDRRVWLRFRGQTAIEPGAYESLEDGEGPFEVHYELPGEGHVSNVHRGVGRLEVREVGPVLVAGILNVCFADAEQSCVSGTFRARPCLSRIDGRALREAPGLSDEALETAGASP